MAAGYLRALHRSLEGPCRPFGRCLGRSLSIAANQQRYDRVAACSASLARLRARGEQRRAAGGHC